MSDGYRDSPSKPLPTRSPAEAFGELWQTSGVPPNLETFFLAYPGISLIDRCAVLRTDMRERWRMQQPIYAEAYLERFPDISDDDDVLLDLVFYEYLRREEAGERPPLSEYAERFPKIATAITSQLELHRYVEGTSVPGTESETRAPKHANLLPDLHDSGFAIGQLLGRYQVLKKLGEGGMGFVYLAEDRILQRQVAFKVPRARLASQPSYLQRFYREARAIAKLQHPYICTVFDCGEIEQHHYISMEYIEGETLSARLREHGPYSPAEGVELMQHIAEAMESAHQAGIVHRDLKPGNIMIDRSGRPCVMDFGLAAFRWMDDGLQTDSGEFLGTPAYSPPEQLRGEPDALGPGCDVYSMGAILYQMLTGKLPFSGNVAVVIKKALDEMPATAESLNPKIPTRLSDICQQAMAKHPSQRYASAKEFHDALQGWQIEADCLPSSVRRKIARERSPSTSRRNRIIFISAMLVLSLLATLAILMPPRPSTDQILPVDSYWQGTFGFDGTSSLPVELRITKRNGDYVEGIYRTENKFEWTVGGPLHGQEVNLRFLDCKQTGPAALLIESGKLIGALDAKTIHVVFSDSHDMSSTEFDLHHVDEKAIDGSTDAP